MAEARAPLSDAFLGALPIAVRRRFRTGEPLEPLLEGLLAAAVRAWPRLSVDPVTFVAHLARRLPAEASHELLSSVHTADLYLAFACRHGNPSAIAAFEATVLPKASSVLDRFERSSIDPTDARQQLRQKLFVAAPDQAPAIGEYSGLGTLANWTRAIAVRLGVRLLKRAPPSVATDPEELSELEAASLDLELLQVSKAYRAPLGAAFREAFALLSTRERNVLKLHFIDHLNIDQIGAMHQVHRSTVARWIQQARRQVAQHTRLELARRCRLSSSELDHVIALLQSQLSSSLGQLLRAGGP